MQGNRFGIVPGGGLWPWGSILVKVKTNFKVPSLHTDMTDAPCTISTSRFEQMRVNKGETAFDWCLGRHVYLQVDTGWYHVFAAGKQAYTASTHLQQKGKGNVSLHREIKAYRAYLTFRQRRAKCKFAYGFHNWKHGSYFTVKKMLLCDQPSSCIWK